MLLSYIVNSVILYLMTGGRPLADKNDDEARKLILRGHRLLKPLNCTDEL